MSQEAKDFIRQFQNLNEVERYEALLEILKRMDDSESQEVGNDSPGQA